MSSTPATALAIGAHPDDVDLGCGATLAAWADAGALVTVAVLTDGSKGSRDPDLGDAELRDAREREQRAAAAVLGAADVRFLRRIDGELAEDESLVLAVAELVREVRPEVVLAHDPWRRYDPHPDHHVAGAVVLKGLYFAREPRAARRLAARGLEPWRPRELLLFDAEAPDHAVAVAGTLDRKVEALLCHRSQHTTSFGIHDDESRERFGAAVRRAAAPDGGPPAERFRRITLPVADPRW